jgi:hypothetical protein
MAFSFSTFGAGVQQAIQTYTPIVATAAQGVSSVVNTVKDIKSTNSGSKPAASGTQQVIYTNAPGTPPPATGGGIETKHILIGGGVLLVLGLGTYFVMKK